MSLELNFADLPPYTVRESLRAKRVIIRISHKDGMVVVVPRGFDKKLLPEILHSHKKWIKNTTARFEDQKKFTAYEPEDILPRFINLRAINQHWDVEYQSAALKNIRTRIKENQQLLVSGDISDRKAVREALHCRLSEQAHVHLITALKQLSKEKKLPYGKTIVRGQKTRWGSCSRHKTVSINYKLLFLPNDLVRYVFLHELCHTVHLNHSEQFWALLADLEPACKTLDNELRQGWQYVPGWVDE